MFKKIIKKIIIILAIIVIGLIGVSNLFFTSQIINDISEKVEINQITVIMLAIILCIICVFLTFRNDYF